MPSLPSRSTAIWKIAVPLLCVAAGAAGGYAARGARGGCGPHRRPVEVREGGYRLISPLLACEAGADLLQSEELSPFRARVETFLRNDLRISGVESIAVYFRELNDGIWFSVGETERFIPASLRKLPMMIALLKQAERDPGFLARPLLYDLAKDYTAAQSIKPSVAMVRGQTYPIGELIRRMIVYSDNNAFTLLAGVVDPEELHWAYAKLDLQGRGDAKSEEFVSVQSAAAYFRILDNASYLGKALSDQALQILTQSDFHSGIEAGVVPGLPVAHKFGEHLDVATGQAQLHDCGIVYYPQHPYILCVMTRGTSFEHLDDAIASVSRFVFDEVRAQVPLRPPLR